VSSRILELAGVLKEGAEAKLYIADAYGNGYDRKAVHKGEMLTRENGDICEFVRLDGDKVVLKNKDGKEHKVSLKDVGGKILPAGQKADKAFFESLYEGHVLGKSDEFKLELDMDGQVHLLDGEGTVRVSMPKNTWKDLAKRTFKSLGGDVKEY